MLDHNLLAKHIQAKVVLPEGILDQPGMQVAKEARHEVLDAPEAQPPSLVAQQPLDIEAAVEHDHPVLALHADGQVDLVVHVQDVVGLLVDLVLPGQGPRCPYVPAHTVQVLAVQPRCVLALGVGVRVEAVQLAVAGQDPSQLLRQATVEDIGGLQVPPQVHVHAAVPHNAVPQGLIPKEIPIEVSNADPARDFVQVPAHPMLQLVDA